MYSQIFQFKHLLQPKRKGGTGIGKHRDKLSCNQYFYHPQCDSFGKKSFSCLMDLCISPLFSLKEQHNTNMLEDILELSSHKCHHFILRTLGQKEQKSLFEVCITVISLPLRSGLHFQTLHIQGLSPNKMQLCKNRTRGLCSLTFKSFPASLQS